MNKRILIADDHYVVRLGTSMILEDYFAEISTDYAENYEEVKLKLHSNKFDLIILDIEMPGTHYKHMIKELKMIQEDVMIMIFSSYKESIALEYVQEGAEGYLNKLSSEKTFIKAIKAIFEDGYYYPLSLIQKLSEKPKKNDVEKMLSEREFQVFKLLIEGNGNLEIANILQIQMTTASTYKRRIYTKLGARNLVDLLKIYNNSQNPN
jgi:DNA-binding NarL/FixJ family response regulator